MGQPRPEFGGEYQATVRPGGLPGQADRSGGFAGGDLRRLADTAARLHVHIHASALEAIGLIGGREAAQRPRKLIGRHGLWRTDDEVRVLGSIAVRPPETRRRRNPHFFWAVTPSQRTMSVEAITP